MKKINGLSFLEYSRQNILILDGASGTTLQKRGLKAGNCPEAWGAQHQEEVIAMQKEYIAAGSKAVYTFTLGGNPVKLKEYGIEDAYAVNKKLAEISSLAAGDEAFVGGDVGSTGLFLEPLGELAFEEAVEIFKQQIKGLYDGGADFIIIETMIDLAEARAALIAAKEVCPLPVAVSLSFDDNGRTLTGSSPQSAAVALIAAGADIIGVNCSTGPDKMVKVVEELKKISSVPILAKPNAGLPEVVDGQTVFNMDAQDFSHYVKPLISAGANLIGGCCGTNSEFIKEVAMNAQGLQASLPLPEKTKAVSCAGTVLTPDKPLIIGCGLDAALNRGFAALLEKKDYESAFDIVMDEKDSGAELLQIYAPCAYEQDAVIELAEIASSRLKFPVVLKTSDPQVAETFLRRYTGRAIINAAETDENAFLAVCASAKKYGAAVILPSGRDMLQKGAGSGLHPADIICTVEAKDKDTVRRCKEKGFSSMISLNTGNTADLRELIGSGINFVLACLQDKGQRETANQIKQ